MKLSVLAEQIGAKVVTNALKSEEVTVQRIYAADTVSDILNHMTPTTLLVTNLANSLLPRVINLLDGFGICLLNGVVPEAELLEAAEEHGVVIVVSPVGMFETCGRLYRCLDAHGQE